MWSKDAIAKVEAHSSEQQVASVIRGLSDVEIDSDRPLEAVTADILKWIENQRSN
jgi:hypothetical protein